MKHIINFLNFYKDKYGSFTNFPEMNFSGVHMGNTEERNLALLAVDELFFHEKIDFTEMGFVESSQYYHKIIIALAKKYLSTNTQEFYYDITSNLLEVEPNYIANNIDILMNNRLTIEFSEDFLNYEIVPIPLNNIDNFVNPGLLVQTYYLLHFINPEDFCKGQNYKKMEAFAEVFSYYLKANNYSEKTPKEKFTFLREYMDSIFNYSYEFVYAIEQNKDQFKATIVLSLMEYLPDFIEDLNSYKMISNAHHYISHITNGNIKNLSNYIYNHKYNPWVNIESTETGNDELFNLTITSYFTFFDSFQSQANKNLKYQNLKNKLDNKNTQIIYLIPQQLPMPANWSNEYKILDSQDYTIDNFQNMLINIIENKYELKLTTLTTIRDYSFKLLMEKELELTDFDFDTSLVLQSTSVLSDTLLHINFENLRDRLKDKDTGLNHFHTYILTMFDDFNVDEKLEIYRLFNMLTDESDSPYFQITKDAIRQINFHQKSDAVAIESFLLEKKLLDDIPEKNNTIKVRKF